MLLYTGRPYEQANSFHWTQPALYDWRDITRLIAAAAAALLSAKLIHGEYISECSLQGHKVRQEQCRGTEPSLQQRCSRLLSLPANNSSQPPPPQNKHIVGRKMEELRTARVPRVVLTISQVFHVRSIHSSLVSLCGGRRLPHNPLLLASDVDVHSSTLGSSALYPSIIKAKFIT